MFNNKVKRYSIRKLAIGATSVLIGAAFLTENNSQKVQAATDNQNNSEKKTDDETTTPNIQDITQPKKQILKSTEPQKDIAAKAKEETEKTTDPSKVEDKLTTTVTIKDSKDGSSELKAKNDSVKKDINTVAQVDMNLSGDKDGASILSFDNRDFTMGIQAAGSAEVEGGKLYFSNEKDNNYATFGMDAGISLADWKEADKVTDWDKVQSALLVKDKDAKQAHASFLIKTTGFISGSHDGIVLKKKDFPVYTKDLSKNSRKYESTTVSVPVKQYVTYTVKYQLSPEDGGLTLDRESDFDIAPEESHVGIAGEYAPINHPEILGYQFASSAANLKKSEGANYNDAYLLEDGDGQIHLFYTQVKNVSVKRTIKDYNKGDDQEPTITTQTVNFEHKVQASQDGKSIVNYWRANSNQNWQKSASGQWQAYTALGRNGYRADKSSIEQKNVTPATKDEVVEIHYLKDSVPVPNIPVTPTPTPVDPDPTPQPHPEPTPDVPDIPDQPDTPTEDVDIPMPHPTDEPTDPDSDIPSDPETVQPHATQVEKVALPSQEIAPAPHAAVNADELPQTGKDDNQSQALAAAGIMAIGLVGMLAGKKKKFN